MSVPSLMTPFPLASMRNDVSPHILPGHVFQWGDRLIVRHLSEILPALAGATWHVNGHCPTWTDYECRCMVEG